MSKVTVPPGCTGLDMADGTRYNAPRRQGGHIDVRPEHATAISRGWYGNTGVIATSEAHSFGTKVGRWCGSCARVWNAWSTFCPRCGGLTTMEES